MTHIIPSTIRHRRVLCEMLRFSHEGIEWLDADGSPLQNACR